MAQGEGNDKGKRKGFWARLLESLDKKMEAKAKSASSCCCSSGPKGKKCN